MTRKGDPDSVTHGRQADMLAKNADEAINTLAAIIRGPPRNSDGSLRHAAKHWARGTSAQVQAALATLDRAGYMPIQRIEQTVDGQDATRELTSVEVVRMLREALAWIERGNGPA